MTAVLIVGAYDFTYHPVIDSNYFGGTFGEGIQISFGTKTTISNNIIIGDQFGDGFLGSYSDTIKIFNNLIMASLFSRGIYTTGVPYLVYNNLILGPCEIGISVTGVNSIETIVANNSIVGAVHGIQRNGTGGVSAYYNNVWGSEKSYYNFTPDSTNLTVDPMMVNIDSSLGKMDFHLQMFSPLIDKGDPAMSWIRMDQEVILDCLGVLSAKSYKYFDFPPNVRRLTFLLQQIQNIFGLNGTKIQRLTLIIIIFTGILTAELYSRFNNFCCFS